MRYDLTIEAMEWSYSRLSAFEDCPYLWLQRYIYEIPGQSKFFAQYGSLMHSILQQYLTGMLHKEELTPYYLSHFTTDITDKAPLHKIHMGYLEQGRQYLKTLSFPARKVIKVEDKMQFQFAGHSFIGFLDLLSEDESGKLYITDHKSRALKPRSNRAKPPSEMLNWISTYGSSISTPVRSISYMADIPTISNLTVFGLAHGFVNHLEKSG